MSIERAVTLLTPVFAAVAAWLTGLIASKFPGLPHLDAAQVTALEIAGFVGAASAAIKWLHDRQKFVRTADSVEDIVAEVVRRLQVTLGPVDLEKLLDSHAEQIVEQVGQLVHAPPSVEDVVEQIAGRLSQAQQMGQTSASTATAPAPSQSQIST
jgi:formate-dependent nitrite reductase membrane component NrfD